MVSRAVGLLGMSDAQTIPRDNVSSTQTSRISGKFIIAMISARKLGDLEVPEAHKQDKPIQINVPNKGAR
jgi:hypothetical protein